MTIRNPIEWAADESRVAGRAMWHPTDPAREAQYSSSTSEPQIRHIQFSDLRDVLARGFADFGQKRADVIFLCIFYPIVGWIVARFASGTEMLPLLFPLVAGFALLGPLAGVGLYEMSRLRERGIDAGWTSAFGVLRSPSIGAILTLGVVLLVLFAAWLLAADAIYSATLGPERPTSLGSFVHDTFATARGWAMIVIGVGVGFVFAVVVLAISVVSFPMLLDRHMGTFDAIRTSVSAVMANPAPMAAWGLIIAVGLVLGSIPLFVGLIVVLPVLGHATWHLYRKLVS